MCRPEVALINWFLKITSKIPLLWLRMGTASWWLNFLLFLKSFFPDFLKYSQLCKATQKLLSYNDLEQVKIFSLWNQLLSIPSALHSQLSFPPVCRKISMTPNPDVIPCKGSMELLGSISWNICATAILQEFCSSGPKIHLKRSQQGRGKCSLKDQKIFKGVFCCHENELQEVSSCLSAQVELWWKLWPHTAPKVGFAPGDVSGRSL